MQGQRHSPSRGMAIPGARDDGGGNERWRVALQSAGSDAGASLSASVQDGFFSSSLRRQGADQGQSHSTFGSLGHGAWLSSSPHPNMRAFPHRPPLHRTPSLQGTPSGFGGLHAHEEALEAAEVGEAAGSPSAAAPGSPPGVSPAGTVGTALSRAALARAATAPAEAAGAPASPLSPRSSGAQPGGVAATASLRTSFEGHPGQRAQRWYLPAGGTATEASEVAEPLLSGYSQDLPVGTPRSVNPYAGTPASNKAASAAAAAVAARSGSLGPGGELVAVARDVRGQDRSTDLSRALVFGLINSIATIPALVAYAAIVFKDPIYAPYLDQLCKFFFLSSAVHQAVFCVLSSLPFAVGQVQDVGLIFLSAMATSIAAICCEAGRDAATALGTSLLTMSAATFFTGACTQLVARYKLAQLVQYLPLPVIGGYLSFVGYFCVASGIGLGVSQDIGSIASWANLFNADALTKLVPTLLSCVAMIATLERFSHPLALPTVLAAINALFHIVRLALGVTLEQAMDANWVIRPAEGEQKFWELWGLFNISDLKLSGIYFPAMAEQVVKTLGLALVVIFGSAMDIAAIQQDTPQKIDFNRELTTVAVSNMATGVAGCGYTGSYIFSQTIFTMRAGVYSRWNGVVVAASELVMFALPFAVIQYLPNFFYGALLLWFGIEISRDWLVLSFNKMTRIEYVLLLATFGAIMQFGLEGGIAAGIVLATLYFAFAYAKSQVASIGVVDNARSSVVRTVEQQAALDMLGGRMTTVSLNGFVFFGSANSIGVRLQQEAERLSPSHVAGSGPAAAKSQEEEAEEAIGNSLQTMGERYVGVKHTQAVAAVSVAPAYLVLDFQHVRGLDATGARTMGVVHSDLAQHGVVLVVTGAAPSMRPLLLAHGVPLPPAPLDWPPEMEAPQAADVQPSVRGSRCGSPRGRTPGGRSTASGEPPSPLGAGAASTGSLAAEQPWEERHWPGAADDGLAQPSCLEFATLEQGLRYCEDQLLEVAVRYGLCQPPSARLPLEDMLASHLAKVPVSGGMEAGAAAGVLRRYVAVVPLTAGQLLWRVGDAANDFFVIEKGVVRVDEFVAAEAEQPSSRALPVTATAGGGGGLPSSASGAPLCDASGRRMVLARSYELGPGCVVGTTDFYLARPHGTRAVCRSNVARVLRFSRAVLERLGVEAPQALNVLQMAVMRANTLDLSQAAQQAPAMT